MNRRKYKDLLASGNAAQIEKLRENDHKDGFDGDNLAGIHVLLEDEVGELWEAIEDRDMIKIRREAADVANYAHMIIYNCDRLLALSSKMLSGDGEGV